MYVECTLAGIRVLYEGLSKTFTGGEDLLGNFPRARCKENALFALMVNEPHEKVLSRRRCCQADIVVLHDLDDHQG